jgi:hypothetical protein
MSYIDTFDHEFVGFLAGLPVYKSLETITYHDEGSRDFPCTPEDFIVGGGGGEHPGLVIKNPNAAVVYFFREWLEEESGLDETEQERLEENLDEFPCWHKVLHFCGWNVDTYHKFLLRCSSNGLYAPYDEEQFGELENWLYTSFGELIFFSFPELAEKAIKSNKEIVDQIKFPFMNNILIQPAGYKPRAGRVIVDDQLQFSLSAWEITKRKT